LRVRAAAPFCEGCCAIVCDPLYARVTPARYLVTPFDSATVRPFFGPLRVRAFVRVR
jgi:hypothetical protein